MVKLPKPLPYDLHQTQWASILDAIISNPLNNASILKDVKLISGNNVVNHKLGRDLQGWWIIRQRAAAAIYDTQDSNQMPQLTLQLVSSANVVVDLAVF